ncbi:hypothetical protein ACFQV4_24055 [Streptomyces thermocarboxydus]
MPTTRRDRPPRSAGLPPTRASVPLAGRRWSRAAVPLGRHACPRLGAWSNVPPVAVSRGCCAIRRQQVAARGYQGEGVSGPRCRQVAARGPRRARRPQAP